MTTLRRYITDEIYVERKGLAWVVSWPGGHMPNCADVDEMLGAVSMAIGDVYHPHRIQRYPKSLMPPCPSESE
jgi:hypothetical protein